MRLNSELIPSKVVSGDKPQHYLYEVSGVEAKSFWLADVSIRGKETLRGPFALGKAYGKQPVLKRIDWKKIKSEHQAQEG